MTIRFFQLHMNALMCLIFFCWLNPLSSNGQASAYIISGELNVPKTGGRIYLYLVDQAHFNVPNSGIDTLELDVASQIVAYKFLEIPPGIYAIRCIQDLNGNKKLDRGLMGPTEPWAFSWKGKKRFPPKFEDLSFYLSSDTTIVLKLEK